MGFDDGANRFVHGLKSDVDRFAMLFCQLVDLLPTQAASLRFHRSNPHDRALADAQLAKLRAVLPHAKYEILEPDRPAWDLESHLVCHVVDVLDEWKLKRCRPTALRGG